MPRNYTFMSSNSSFITLGVPNNQRERTAHTKSILLIGTNRTSLDISPP